MKKRRNDAWDTPLTEAQRWEAYERSKGVPWPTFAAWLAEEYGLTVGKTAIYDWQAWMRRQEGAHRLERAIAARQELKGLSDYAALPLRLRRARRPHGRRLPRPRQRRHPLRRPRPRRQNRRVRHQDQRRQPAPGRAAPTGRAPRPPAAGTRPQARTLRGRRETPGRRHRRRRRRDPFRDRAPRAHQNHLRPA